MKRNNLTNFLFKKLHIEKTDDFIVQFYRYLIVGGSAFIIDFSILFTLTEHYNIYYLTSATISFIIGSIVNYIVSTKWIFSQKSIFPKQTEFWLFLIIGVFGLIINNIIIFILGHFVGIYYLFSKLISATIVLLWNFIARRTLLFSLTSKPVFDINNLKNNIFPSMRIAIFHDYFRVIGGAEKLVLILAKHLGADIITAEFDPLCISNLGHNDTRIISLGKKTKISFLLPNICRERFSECNFTEDYDLFIFSGSFSIYAAKKHKPNMWYCHSPIRGLYDLKK